MHLRLTAEHSERTVRGRTAHLACCSFADEVACLQEAHNLSLCVLSFRSSRKERGNCYKFVPSLPLRRGWLAAYSLGKFLASSPCCCRGRGRTSSSTLRWMDVARAYRCLVYRVASNTRRWRARGFVLLPSQPRTRSGPNNAPQLCFLVLATLRLPFSDSPNFCRTIRCRCRSRARCAKYLQRMSVSQARALGSSSVSHELSRKTSSTVSILCFFLRSKLPFKTAQKFQIQ